MKYSIKTSVATIVISVLFTGFSPAAMADKKPYCTRESNQGAYWWTWTASSLAKACKVAKKKVEGSGQSVNWTWKSYYSSDGLNQGTLICHKVNGQKKLSKLKVIGYGANIFPNAMNARNKKGFSACYFKMKK